MFFILDRVDDVEYSWLVLVSWLSFIKYMRAIESMRIFIQLLQECIKTSVTFIAVLCIFIFGFACTFSIQNQQDGFLDEGASSSFIDNFKHVYRLMLGDFDVGKYKSNTWAVFGVASVLMSVIMINLLIAIISDQFDMVMADIQASSYKQLCEILLE